MSDRLNEATPSCVVTIAFGGAADASEVADTIRWVAQEVGVRPMGTVRAKAPGNGYESLTKGEVHLYSLLRDLADRVNALDPQLR